jgi:hypothetical protein
MITVGTPCVFGIQPIKPLIGFPEGKAKIRLRSNGLAKVFIKTPTGVRQFIPEEKDGSWHPRAEIGRNQTI